MSTPNFDRIAPLYRWAEYLTLGPLLERARNHFLPKLIHSRQALILGDGDGRFTARLLATNPTIQVQAVDTSAAMLKLLRRNATLATLTADSRLRTTHANALEIQSAGETDLIVTHFFLDCLTKTELDALIPRHARPGTLWLLSDFRIPPGPLRLPANLYIRALYLAFRLLTGLRVTRLPDYATPLRRAGFIPIAVHYSLFGLLTSELWQLPPKSVLASTTPPPPPPS